MQETQWFMMVKFKTALPPEEAMRIAVARMEDFRTVKGLQQKFYLQDPQTGEFAGLYVWDSLESLQAYRDSELRASIAAAYQTEGPPRVEVFRTVGVLREV